MRKVLSPKLQKQYWIGSCEFPCLDGLPVFSEDELRKFKESGYTDEQFLFMYNLRLEAGEEKESPREEIGYKPKDSSKDYTSERYRLAEKYSKQIQETITKSKIRGDKYDALQVANPETPVITLQIGESENERSPSKKIG